VFAAGGAVDVGVAIGVARFAELARLCGVPAVAVGGITPGNAASVLAAGASGVAVISALFAAPDPMRAARAFRSVLGASES
jgi:thiamine monophosphate synthase